MIHYKILQRARNLLNDVLYNKYHCLVQLSNMTPTIASGFSRNENCSLQSPTFSKNFCSKSLRRFDNILGQKILLQPTRTLTSRNVFCLHEANAGRIQPCLDIEHVLNNFSKIEDSMEKRGLTCKSFKEVTKLYQTAHDLNRQRENIQKEREENTIKCQEVLRNAEKGNEDDASKVFKEKGRELRELQRRVDFEFNEVNDELVNFILSLPNTLDDETPTSTAKLVSETKPPPGIEAWAFPRYTAVESKAGPGILAEFPTGETAWANIKLREKCQKHLLDGNFIETGNAEYVKRQVLSGAGLEPSDFIRIREPNVKKGWDHATYLVGGASFPSFLSLFAQSIIENSEVLPIRYFVIGQSYENKGHKPGYFQRHCVQAFVACRSEEEMHREFKKLESLMKSFYAVEIGFSFQTQLVPASRLLPHEQKKLAFVMNKTEDHPSKMIGTLSAIGDYVSKRLLCCYFGESNETKFLHLITAEFFDITHFLRPSSPTLETIHSALNLARSTQSAPKETNHISVSSSGSEKLDHSISEPLGGTGPASESRND